MPISTLDRQSTASAISIEDLLIMAQQGRIRVPDFQRAYKWSPKQVELLLDSVLRDYPIGTLLFWVHPARAQRVQFGAWGADCAARENAWWVVDGQQRIHSLVATLLGPEEGRASSDRHAFVYDLEGQLVSRVRDRPPRLHDVPLPVLADGERLLAWLLDMAHRGLPARYQPVALAANRRIREYRIPAYIVTDPSMETAKRVFVRMNTTGVAMKDVDVFPALSRSVDVAGEDGPHHDPLADLTLRLAETGFGELPGRLLAAAVVVANGLDPIAKRSHQLTELDLEKALRVTEPAIRRAITFLVDDARLPHASLIPFQFLFTLLVRFFACHPEPHPRSRQLLARVVWRGLIGEQLRGTSASDVTHLLAACELPEARAITELARGTMIPAIRLPDLHWAPRRASTRIVLCAMADARPARIFGPEKAFDLRRGEPLLAEEVLFRGHHLPQVSDDTSDAAGRLYNPPLRDVRDALLSNPDAAGSHGFDDMALACLREGKLDAALNRRREWLRELVKRFLDRACALDYGDAPAAETLLAAMDSP